MSSISKKLIIFGAEYLVVVEGTLFVCVAFQKNTVEDTVLFILFGIVVILISLFAAHLLKLFFHRNRPPKSEELFVPGDVYAFPSEHATALSALSLIVVMEDVVLGLVVIGIGLIIIVCRVLARVHRTQDMIIGTMLGGFVAYGCLVYGAPYIELIFGTL